MARTMTRTRTYTIVSTECDHPGDRVTADKLQGDSEPTFVQWCQLCGAVRVGKYDMDRWPVIAWVGEWDLPELRRITPEERG